MILYDFAQELAQVVIMKGKRAANIQLADILGNYRPQDLGNYFPPTLRQELEDLRTLSHIAALNIPAHCSVPGP